MDSHEKYIELCAASTAGELSREEEQELQEHLAVCASCRRAKHEYEMTVEKAVPALADDLASAVGESDSNWSVEQAEAAFFKRLRTDQNAVRGSTPEWKSETSRRVAGSPIGRLKFRGLNSGCRLRRAYCWPLLWELLRIEVD